MPNKGFLLTELLHQALGLKAGESSFPWQERLLNLFAQGNMPVALDIPTGLGKTSVMAIWLVARAIGAPVPRRLVYVVDRRAVVDQATEFAEQLREFVKVNPEVKEGLGLLGDLPISTLRGQFVDNREWLDDPSSPAIIVGTVDMIGSRLLFSGYGVSSKMRPYHAGFLGNDSLVVLDEAHLVQPFERLIEQVAQGVDTDKRPLRPLVEKLGALIPRFRCMSLSATGRERNDEMVFQLNDDDRKHEIVARRLGAKKRMVVRPAVPEKELAETLASEAWSLSENGVRPDRYIVYCNSRACAQDVLGRLEVLMKKSGQVIETELFVGARRVYERARLANWLRERGFMSGKKVALDHPVFVIATSAGEVGVDLDADHAVCDLVAWERMVQRFGRVNRRGEGAAEIVVVPQEPGDPEKDPNAKYTPHLLALIEALPRTEGGEGANVSPEGLLSLREQESLRARIEQASTLAPLHPPLTRALVESWSMTSLDEHTGRPEVAPWIRGWPDREEEPQTTVVWREFLPIRDDGRLLEKQEMDAFRNAADPHLAEKLETQTWRVLEWLVRRVKNLESEKPEDSGSLRPDRQLRKESVVAVILDPEIGASRIVKGEDVSSKEGRERLKKMLAGATLLVDSKLGGLENGLLMDGSESAALDVTTIDTTAEANEAEKKRVVPFRVRYSTAEPETSEGWRLEAAIPVAEVGDETKAWLVIESVVDRAAESEEARSVSKKDQSLAEHEQWAEDEARAIASRLCLPLEYAEMLAVAARLHDEGKQARHWQDAFGARHDGRPYAKTTRRPRFAILGGYRHELGSLPYAERDARVQALPPDLRRLCLRLIVAHHGYARPVIRIENGTEPPTRLRKRAQAIALEFCALEKQWGPWGLAWWESLLRAADQRASRRLDAQARKGVANG